MPALTPARDRSVRFRFRIFGLAAAFAMSSVALGAPGGTARRKITGPVVVEPEEDTTTPLALPDAGLQSRMWSAPRDNYVPRANVLYARFTWKDWGRLGRKKIGHFKGWMARKRYIGLRMYCNTVGDLPQGVNVPAHNAGRRHSPLYWSPQYMKAHRAFVQAVGKALAADPYLAYVDIGGVGNTGGEWLVYPDDRWGARPSFVNAGYSAENRDRMLWAVIRMYREAFPHVRLYLATAAVKSAGNKQKLYDYMKKNNIGFRLDGLCGQTTDRNGWQYRAKLHKLWLDHPFQWEGAYSTMEWEKDRAGWSTAAIMKAALVFGPQMITYADADRDAVRFEKDPKKAAILTQAALELGYRIAITRVRYPGTVRSGRRFRIHLAVANRGCSKMYADREMEVSFLNAAGRPRAAVKVRPRPPTSQWMPGKTIPVVLDVPLPANAPSGTCMLALAMMDEDPRRPDTRIEMALTKKTPEDRYLVDRIVIRAGGASFSRGRKAAAVPQAGPLVKYAREVAVCRRWVLDGNHGKAAAHARALAAKASGPARDALTLLADGFAATAKLRRLIIDGHDSKRVTVLVNVGRGTQAGRFVRADEGGIVVSIRGVQVPIGWNKMGLNRFCGIAAKFTESAPEHLTLARFAASICPIIRRQSWRFSSWPDL